LWGLGIYQDPAIEQGRLPVTNEGAGQRTACAVIEISDDDECQEPNNTTSEPPTKKSKFVEMTNHTSDYFASGVTLNMVEKGFSG